MSQLDDLAGEIGKLFVGVAKDIYGKFSTTDQEALAAYARNVAQLTLALPGTTDPAKKARIVDNLQTYANATLLMVARYELMAASGVEKAAVAGLKLAIEVVIKLVIATM